MGVANITVYDFDVVSIENMNNQFYRFKDIGKPKVEALASLIEDFTGVKIAAHNRKFVEFDVMNTRGVLVTALDTMEGRAMVHKALGSYHNVSHVIDPRMSAEFFVQYALAPSSKEQMDVWNTTLFKDSDAVPTPCTAKSTVYTATLAAGHVVKTIKNILLSEPYPRSVNWNIKASSNSFDSFQ
jgi:sulfur carrier protein ThiS adenylyltransferase